MYQKLHRWSDEDETVALDTEDMAETEETVESDEESAFVVDYRRRIHPEDEE